jgi:DNA-binding NarL/FixJ family response regulator
MYRLEVPQLLAGGPAAKEIANRLKLTSRTVEFHEAHIMDHINLQTGAGLIKCALTHGIVSASSRWRIELVGG